MSTIDLAKFDVRTIERYLAEGRVTREEYAKHLASIEDSANNADESNVRMQAVNQRVNIIISDD